MGISPGAIYTLQITADIVLPNPLQCKVIYIKLDESYIFSFETVPAYLMLVHIKTSFLKQSCFNLSNWFNALSFSDIKE